MKKKIYWKIVIVLASLTAILNLIAFSKGFCDFYTDHVYKVISGAVGRVTDILPFMLGEWLMYLGILLVAAAVVILIVFAILHKKSGVRRFAAIYYKSLLMILVAMLFVYTITWSVPIRGSLLGNNSPSTVEIDYEDVRTIRNHIVEELNKAAYEVPRDEDGYIIFPESIELQKGVIRGMQSLADEYPRLSGFYPHYKEALCSDFLEWSFIAGFTFPYTMEVLLNRYSAVNRLNMPTLFAHESAHHKGFYKESEGDFFAYIGCINSDNIIVRYAGLIEAYNEADSAFYDALEMLSDEEADALIEEIRGDMSDEELMEYFYTVYNPMPDEIVFEDIFGEHKKEEEAYEEAEHPFESFEGIAEEVSEVGWDTQEKIMKEYNYKGSTALMLQYFSKKLGLNSSR